MNTSFPEVVSEAERLAQIHGFKQSCTRRVGNLLRTLAGHARGRVLEVGTGYGVGTAWLLSGLPPKAEIITIDSNPVQQESVTNMFSGVEQVKVVCGDWRDALAHGPYDLVFVDVGDAKDAGANDVIAATAIGGLILLDDFTPGPFYQGVHDERWHHWMLHKQLAASELLTESDSAVILATRTS